MRKAILFILGLILIVGSIFIAKWIIDNNIKEKPEPKTIEKPVFIYNVQNTSIPVNLSTNGSVEAVNKFEIFAEVEGVFRSSSHPFRPGQAYKRGEILIDLNEREFAANVQSVKSQLYNSIASIMPDLRLDYPEVYPKWKTYLDNFEMDKPTPELPEFENNKERYFITGRQILTDYYNLKNLEERLLKFKLIAPFDGVLTEASVNEGTLVRQGQKLGEFIDPSVYELEISIKKEYIKYIEVGNSVEMKTLDDNLTFKGKIVRINAQIDPNTQTVQVFIRIENKLAKEGMYLEAIIKANTIENAIRIPRELLIRRSKVYIIENNRIKQIEVQPKHFSDQDVIITGVPDGTKLLANVVPGAYVGMKVTIEGEQKP
ncbi:efflux RND transporter periplasmic adaptor subunit [Psychroflexus aestuariivivens]|uniref:efflux RND transporter periplasmic adaptor subunit n=1 Tax=Psychroflexus aestuariivivens TaxID=1795040 RepID=UPI000FD6DB65|nr:efflux RND transporter periplasmic adaptor subunit [Psychroflexus aestuariivivens]